MKIEKAKIRSSSHLLEPVSPLHKESGSPVNIFNENKKGEFYMLSLEKLVPYKKQARKIFSEEELESLADSIRTVGITSPLLVIRSDEAGKFEVVNGERRLRAAKLAGLEKIPCILKDSDNDSEMVALIDNIQRADLHPIEFANAFQSMLKNYVHGDMTVLAKKIGVVKSHVSESLKLLTLPPEVQKYLLDNNIRSRDQLRKLLKCSTKEEMGSILGIIKKDRKQIARKLFTFYIENGDIRFEFNKINLNDNQKSKIKKTLEEFFQSF
jgi:ParB family chromosome partitioning protein